MALEMHYQIQNQLLQHIDKIIMSRELLKFPDYSLSQMVAVTLPHSDTKIHTHY